MIVKVVCANEKVCYSLRKHHFILESGHLAPSLVCLSCLGDGSLSPTILPIPQD